MKVLDKELDQKPSPKKVKEMAELRIRNLLCFSELTSYNNTGKWKYKHPLIIHQSERAQLEHLFQTNPQEFLKQYSACSNNIKRYTSYLKNTKRKDNREKDKANLKRHKEREVLFQTIFPTTKKS